MILFFIYLLFTVLILINAFFNNLLQFTLNVAPCFILCNALFIIFDEGIS